MRPGAAQSLTPWGWQATKQGFNARRGAKKHRGKTPGGWHADFKVQQVDPEPDSLEHLRVHRDRFLRGLLLEYRRLSWRHRTTGRTAGRLAVHRSRLPRRALSDLSQSAP